MAKEKHAMSMALILSALGALAVSSGIALAAAQPLRSDDQTAGDMTRAEAAAKAGERFARMDVNKDGKLDAADRAAHHSEMAAAMFERIDADRDGSISREEWNAGAARLAEAHGGPQHALKMRRPAVLQAGTDLPVSRQEFEARALERFDRADLNKDGKLSPGERQAARGLTRLQVERD